MDADLRVRTNNGDDEFDPLADRLVYTPVRKLKRSATAGGKLGSKSAPVTPMHSRPNSNMKRSATSASLLARPQSSYELARASVKTPTYRGLTRIPGGSFTRATRDDLMKPKDLPRVSTAAARMGRAPGEVSIKSPIHGGFGKQVVAESDTRPSVSFASSTRDAWRRANGLETATDGAGPGSYQTTKSIGPQTLSHQRSLPCLSFPTASRGVKAVEDISPGPVYKAMSSIGEGGVTMPVAERKSSWRDPPGKTLTPAPYYIKVKHFGKRAPSFSFGTSAGHVGSRPLRKVTPGPEKITRPVHGGRRQPSFGFSKAKRF